MPHFYTKVLNAKKETFNNTRLALVFKKFNVHPFYGEPIYPRAENPIPGSLDICFCTEKSIESLKAYFEGLNIPVIEGPVDRTGALGPMRSIYIRDPDGNLLEFANYPRTSSKVKKQIFFHNKSGKIILSLPIVSHSDTPYAFITY